jgi:hypothetical protein
MDFRRSTALMREIIAMCFYGILLSWNTAVAGLLVVINGRRMEAFRTTGTVS